MTKRCHACGHTPAHCPGHVGLRSFVDVVRATDKRIYQHKDKRTGLPGFDLTSKSRR